MSVSITSTESFAIRAQRSEERRVVLWLAVLVGMALITLGRRLAHGAVMSHAEVFLPYQGALVFAMAVQVVVLAALRRANRGSYLLPKWLPRASAMFDMCVAVSLLVIVAFLSPRGPVPALSGPALLLMPLVVLMSVLQLRPRFTLIAGLAGAMIHLLLAIRAVVVTDALPEAYAVYFAYSAILAITAIAGMLVAHEIKKHVREAAEEAAAHERVDRQVVGMQRDLSVAREIQQGLLPRQAPALEGFEIVGMNRPADQTGGDYWDWQQLPDGRLAVALADVAGHGIGPAIVMAVCRAYARSTAPVAPDPAVLLTRLNALLEGDIPGDRFITFAMAVFNCNGAVQFISAGHGPTLLYRASTGTVTQFGGDGMPLGVMASEEYGPTNNFAMEEGDVLFMLTDGFFEGMRPGDEEAFGTARLEKALADAAKADAATILRKVDETVCRFCDGASQLDDMTAVVIKRTAPVRKNHHPVDSLQSEETSSLRPV